ncbi:TPA: hypothetical protein O5G22_002365 [Staphylococcus aureus]|nr:hypothetical protein [Staphylococcus aureus]HCQ3583764.1 hypothetical protein [Staphylococcus aureus]HCT6777132.1 hypothetical protein [Staphylococcus aureus]HCY7345429.1 hypothetical protein [Staphylococcus aureus]HDA0659994.1 hypothetical protein [Staphylococcus aureus]
MILALTILLWVMVVGVLFVFSLYVLAFISAIILKIKSEKDFEKTKNKKRENFEAFAKQCEERMRAFKEEHSHVSKEIEKHHKGVFKNDSKS